LHLDLRNIMGALFLDLIGIHLSIWGRALLSCVQTTMVAPLYTTDSGLLFHAGKILILTVGLPARGKTHISRALERYLRWCGVKTTVVSLGDYRRKTLGGAQQLPPDYFTLGEPGTIAV
jgi:6-phosphofructo-2-kinase / fructose-2,6-biphosphatase 4